MGYNPHGFAKRIFLFGTENIYDCNIVSYVLKTQFFYKYICKGFVLKCWKTHLFIFYQPVKEGSLTGQFYFI